METCEIVRQACSHSYRLEGPADWCQTRPNRQSDPRRCASLRPPLNGSRAEVRRRWQPAKKKTRQGPLKAPSFPCRVSMYRQCGPYDRDRRAPGLCEWCSSARGSPEETRTPFTPTTAARQRHRPVRPALARHSAHAQNIGCVCESSNQLSRVAQRFLRTDHGPSIPQPGCPAGKEVRPCVSPICCSPC